jgi:hypothetical protein
MTIVTAHILQPDPGAGQVPSRGYLRWAPSRARVSDGTIITALPFTVPLVDGVATADVEPSGTDWVWAVTYRLLGIKHVTRYYIVPDVPTIDIEDLVEVDPATLDPAAQPDPGWYALLDSLAAGQIGVVHVTTGNEARTPYGTVLWLGGTTQPVNMAEGTDVWFKASA